MHVFGFCSSGLISLQTKWMSTDDADPNAAHEGASIASASFSEQDVQLRINNDHIAGKTSKIKGR